MIKLNGYEIKPTTFPDCTSQVWKLDKRILKGTHAAIEWDFDAEFEFIELAQLKDLVDITFQTSSLVINYLPYARQDKPVSNEATFALRTFAKLLNSLKFKEVICRDPHSTVALELIDNFIPVYPVLLVENIFVRVGADVVCYPDKGAYDKYTFVYKDCVFPTMHATKVRDQSTGEIKGHELFGEPSGKIVLIVDDICDGGATFISLAKMLREKGAEGVHLFVSHGIFSKGTKILRDAGIGRIFTIKGEML